MKPSAKPQKPTAGGRKTSSRAVAAPRAKTPAVRPPKRSPEERKAKAVELMLVAIAGGWTLKRFARRSGVSVRTLMRWIAEPTIQPRYFDAMRTKAVTLPDEALEIVDKLKAGGEWVTIPDPKKAGEFVRKWMPVNVKALSTALRHYEFRMMREIKAIYQASVAVERPQDPSQLTDEKLDARIEEILERAQNARLAARNAPPAAGDEKTGPQ